MKEKRPSLAVVIGMGKPKGKPMEDDHEDEMDSGEEGDGTECEDAMSEFLDAVEKKDVSVALEAFRALLDLCRADDEPMGEDE